MTKKKKKKKKRLHIAHKDVWVKSKKNVPIVTLYETYKPQ